MSIQTTETPRFSAWSGLIQTLTNPSAAFASLAEHPKPPFFLAYVVTGLCAIPMIFATFSITMDAVQKRLANQGVPPEAATIAKGIGLVTGGLGAIFGPMLLGLGIALLAMLVGLFVGGGVRFRQYYSMLAYAGLPAAIDSLIQAALAVNASTLADLQQLSLSPAAFLPADSSRLLIAMLGLLNPFTLWTLYLQMTGFAALHRTTRSKGAIFAGTVLVFQALYLIWGATRAIPQ